MALKFNSIFLLSAMLCLTVSMRAQTTLNRLNLNGVRTVDTTMLNVSTSINPASNVIAQFLQPNLTSGNTSYIFLGKHKREMGSGFLSYQFSPDENNTFTNRFSMGFPYLRKDGNRIYRNYLSFDGDGNFDFAAAENYKTARFYFDEPTPNGTFFNSYIFNLGIGAKYNGVFENYVNLKYVQYHDDTPQAANQPPNYSLFGHKSAFEMGLTGGQPVFLRYLGKQWEGPGNIPLKDVYYLMLGNVETPLRTLYINTNKDLANTGVASLGHTLPDPSSLLDLNYQGTGSDIGRGLLLPRYTTANLTSTNFYQPATGLLAFDQTLNRVVMNAGIPSSRNWKPMVVGTSSASSIESGTATFSGANFTVNNSNVTANSLIILTVQNGVMATYVVTNKTSGSFTINSSDSVASKVIGYLIIN